MNKDSDIVPEEVPLIRLDIKYSVCRDDKGKDNKHNRHIYIRVHLVRNNEKYK